MKNEERRTKNEERRMKCQKVPRWESGEYENVEADEHEYNNECSIYLKQIAATVLLRDSGGLLEGSQGRLHFGGVARGLDVLKPLDLPFAHSIVVDGLDLHTTVRAVREAVLVHAHHHVLSAVDAGLYDRRWGRVEG